jgi:large subunit ribosomal protein L25
MQFEKLTVEVRAGRKKSIARQIRRDGKIPGICYGRDMQPLAVSLDPKALGEVVAGVHGRNVVIEMSVSGDGAPAEPMLVMLQDFQHHPLARQVLHADFVRVAEDRPVRVRVPFETTGRAPGVQAGGVLTQVFRDLPVRCLPAAIPSKLTLDVATMNLGEQRKVADLVVPDGIVVDLEPNRTLVTVLTPSVAKTADEGAGEGEAEAAVVAEGATAPAATEKAKS